MTRAIITDLDGTILPHKGEISSSTREAFILAGKQKCQRIIATGRNLYASLQVLPGDFPIDYLVFSSGAGIMRWRDRKILTADHLTPSHTRYIARYLWNHNINFIVQREIPENHYFFYTDFYPLHKDYKQRIATYAPFGSSIHSPEEITGPATQFVVILDALQLRLFETMYKDLKDFSVVRSTSPQDNRALWLEIFAPGISKGNACRKLLHALGIDHSEWAGIGNDYNDLDFLDMCGKAFLVANAPATLQHRYKLVGRDCEEGFTQFIHRVLSGENGDGPTD